VLSKWGEGGFEWCCIGKLETRNCGGPNAIKAELSQPKDSSEGNRKWQDAQGGRTIVNNWHPRGRNPTKADNPCNATPFSGAANAANHGHNHNYIRSDNVEKQFEREASQLQFELTMEPRKIASFRRSYFIFISESDTHGVLRCYGSGIKQ